MTVVAEQNAVFEATTVPGVFDTGLVGTLGVRIDDNQGNTVVGRTTAGIIEYPAGSSIYAIASLTAPATVGQYTLTWDDGAGSWATEELVVVLAGSTIEPIPPVTPPVPGSASTGPCSDWTTGDYVAEICAAAESTDTTIYEPFITIASDLLFRLSGRQYPGECEMTVRPCGTGGICAGWAWPLTDQELNWVTWAYYGGMWGWYWPDGRSGCGCHHVDRVHLPDYPVRSIVEVNIDGEVVDDSTYALREFRFLDRLDDAVWPSCQDMRLELGEVGTWGVTYTWGMPLPASGVAAAAALACELYTESIGGECALPQGVTQITRQGVTMSRSLFAAWGMQNGLWATGIPAVDAFLQANNPQGLTGPTTVWSPDLEPFPRPEYA